MTVETSQSKPGSGQGAAVGLSGSTDRDRIRQMYVEKVLSTSVIAEELGVSPRTVQSRLLGMGIPLRPSRRPRRFGTDSIRIAGRMKRAGSTYPEVAEAVGCSYSTAITLVAWSRLEESA